MRNLMDIPGIHRIRVLRPLMAMILILAVVVGMTGQVDAQTTSRYTLDDVMDKLIDMDKKFEVHLGKLETKVDMIEKRMVGLDKRIDDTNSTMRWLFGLLGTLFLGILGATLATYKNTASLVKPTERNGVKESEVLETLRKEVRELVAEEESALEKKLQAVDRGVPKEPGILEALRQEVSALAERQRELERKLTPAEAV